MNNTIFLSNIFSFSIFNLVKGWSEKQNFLLLIGICVAILLLALVSILLIARFVHKRKKDELEAKEYILKLNETLANSSNESFLQPIASAKDFVQDDFVKSDNKTDTYADNILQDSEKLDLMIKQIELSESMASLPNLDNLQNISFETVEKQNVVVEKAPEPVASEKVLETCNNLDKVSTNSPTSILEKIYKRKQEIAILRGQIKNIIGYTSCALLKEKFYTIYLSLDDDEKSSDELVELLLKSMNDANYAAELARSRYMNQSSRVVTKNQEQHARPTTRTVRPSGARPQQRSSGSRQSASRPSGMPPRRPSGMPPRR